MAIPTSKNSLIDYCMRELGAPVINIEMDEEQASDRIDYVIKKFIDRHYDGVTRAMYKLVLTKEDDRNGYVSMPNEFVALMEVLRTTSGSSIEPMDSYEYHLAWDIVLARGMATVSDYYINMSHLELIRRILGTDKSFVYNSITKQIFLHHIVSYKGGGNYFKQMTDFTATDWTALNSVLTQDDVETEAGKLKGATCTSSAAGVFGFNQLVESNGYMLGTHSTEITLMAGTYTGSVNIIVEDGSGTVYGTKTVQPVQGRWNTYDMTVTFDDSANKDVRVRVESVTAAAGGGETFFMHTPELYVNNYIVLHGYKAIDTEAYENVWGMEWIMKYSTALLKKQWGSNVKKYSGVQLPGGVEMNGQTIYDEAVAELDKLDEEFSSAYELPIDFFIE